ncbi:hypothetical protein [Pseudomonas uvaldensis]|uniref:hypothetical protein n=1 Tax=Pseudomonas uvaldensis TaxID=2878385 RepID=UPI001E5F906C|nr:hypothetical protein [Pseudomonas uvaldensis]MCE0464850.1 hypothetical protein [Pseudomonas uvaldensis]
MKNETVTLSRELAERLAGMYIPRLHREAVNSLSELRAALDNQRIVCSNGILCQNSKCPECGGNGSYTRAALAEPVPPAGGEAIPDRATNANCSEIMQRIGKYGVVNVWHGADIWNACLDACTSTVTRLQAEVAHLRQHKNDYMEAAEETRKALQSEVERLNGLLENQRQDRKRHTSQAVKHVDEIVYLQSELTKALMLIEHAYGAIERGEEWNWLLDRMHTYMAHQSAPAAKDGE